MLVKIWVQPATYTISYSLSGTATTKDLVIDVNGSNVVNCTSGCFGTIIINPGDDVFVSTSCSTGFPLLVSLTLDIVDNGSLIYSNGQSGNSFASDTYGAYTPTGDGSITSVADEY